MIFIFFTCALLRSRYIVCGTVNFVATWCNPVVAKGS